MDKKLKQFGRTQTLVLLTINPKLPSHQCPPETRRIDTVTRRDSKESKTSVNRLSINIMKAAIAFLRQDCCRNSDGPLISKDICKPASTQTHRLMPNALRIYNSLTHTYGE